MPAFLLNKYWIATVVLLPRNDKEREPLSLRACEAIQSILFRNSTTRLSIYPHLLLCHFHYWHI